MAAAEQEGLAADVDHAFENADGLGLGLQAIEHQHEFVAAQARHALLGAHGVLQAGADFLEQRVAKLMAERVVDVLEAVQVHQRHGERHARAGGAGHVLLDAAADEGPVANAGQRVQEGAGVELALVLDPVRDVVAKQQQARRGVGLAGLVGDAQVQPAAADAAGKAHALAAGGAVPRAGLEQGGHAVARFRGDDVEHRRAQQVFVRVDEQVSRGFGGLEDATLDIDPHGQRAGSFQQRPGLAPGRAVAGSPAFRGLWRQGNIICKRGHVFLSPESPWTLA
ncbi:hypothetical protein D3C72_1242220 [compost metagenome]